MAKNVTIDRETFKKLEPKSRRFSAEFPLDKPIIMVAFHKDEDDLVEWGNDWVPTIELDDGTKVPAPKILHNMVVSKPDIIKNEGVTITVDGKERSLECAAFVGNTLYDYLEQQAKENDQEEIELPGEITPKQKISKGIELASITSDGKKEIYEQSYYVPEGKSFDTALGKYEYIPAIFKSATGTLRNNYCQLLAPID